MSSGLTELVSLETGIDDETTFAGYLTLNGEHLLFGCLNDPGRVGREDEAATDDGHWLSMRRCLWPRAVSLSMPFDVPRALIVASESWSLRPAGNPGSRACAVAAFATPWRVRVDESALLALDLASHQWALVERWLDARVTVTSDARHCVVFSAKGVTLIELEGLRAVGSCPLTLGERCTAITANRVGTHFALQCGSTLRCHRLADGGVECEWEIEGATDTDQLFFAEDDLAVLRVTGGGLVSVHQWRGDSHPLSEPGLRCRGVDPSSRRAFFVNGHDFVEVDLTTGARLSQGSFEPNDTWALDLGARRVAVLSADCRRVRVFALPSPADGAGLG